MALIIGATIHHDRYRIDSLLGKGGMGAVYKAWDISLEIPVAIKENLEDSTEAQKQFNREANILARLSHPNLPRVTDYFLTSEGQYLVMDFIEGEDLKSMLKRLGHLPEPEVLTWIGQVADALAYLHSQIPPIIHRDIKPANIRIRQDGRAMLVDFGIAKIYDPSQATTSGAKAVTPGYSPPEQYGGAVTDTRADIYALGATLYHLLTGKEPPESVQRIVNKIPMQSPRELNVAISPEVEQVILRSTEIPTDRRFQSMDELRKALTHPVETGENAEQSTAAEQPPVRPTSSRDTISLPAEEISSLASASPASPKPEAVPAPAQAPTAAQPARKLPVWTWVVAALVVVGCIAVILAAIFVPKMLKESPTSTTTKIAVAAATLTWTPVVQNTLPLSPTSTSAPALRDTPTPQISPTSVEISSAAPTSYTPVGSLLPPEGEVIRGVAEKDGYAYLLTRKAMLYIYDLTGMTNFQEMTVYDTPIDSLVVQNGIGLMRNGDYMYVFGNAGIQVVDISNASNPVPGELVKDLRIFNMSISGTTLVAPGDGYIGIYDISDPSIPRKINMIKAGEGHSNLAAAVYQNMLYVTDFSNINNNPKSVLKVYDISEPTITKLVQTIDIDAAYHLVIFNDKLIRCTPNDVELMDLNQKDYPRYLTDQRGEAYACLFDRGNLVANGVITAIDGRNLRPLLNFDIKSGAESLPASTFTHDQSLPFFGYVNPNFVFFAQNGRILILASH